jgi:chemosensory pili system protein ChpA (sensor histidine kinase/response regulator)
MNVATEFDIGPLTWVMKEIDLALERAVSALDEFDAGAADSTRIRSCRTHLHQVWGALSIVGLDGVTQFVEALEGLLEMIEAQARPADDASLGLARRALEAIGLYLGGVIDGQANQPLRLLPLYQEIQTSRGVPHHSAADLFFPDLSVQPPRQRAPATPLDDAERAKRLRQERSRFQRGLLAWLHAPKEERDGIREMQTAIKRIEKNQEIGTARAFWWVTGGLLTALDEGRVPDEASVKPLCARIDVQIRRLLEGSKNVAERLMRDVLYLLAGSKSDDLTVGKIKEMYRLDALFPADGDAIVPEAARSVIGRLREVIAVLEEAWNKFCAGSTASLSVFRENAALLSTLVGQTGHTDYRRLAQAVATAAHWLAETPTRHSEALAMELATAILLVGDAQKDYPRLGGDFAHQVDVTVERIHACLAGHPPETTALDEISRRAQERLLTGQVAKEIQNNLLQVEQGLDAFFRDTEKRPQLAGIEKPLQQIVGALTLLRREGAAAAARDCLETIRRFVAPDSVPSEDEFERLASRLSMLGFFVEAMSRGAKDFESFVRKMQVTDPTKESVELEVVQSRRETCALQEALREQPEDAGLQEEIRQNLETLRSDADLVADAKLGEQAKAMLDVLASDADAAQIEQAVAALEPKAAPPRETWQISQASSEEIDAELLAIFLEEAREVMATVEAALCQLKGDVCDSAALTTLWRSFHTLKGSGRMVGLEDLSKAAWAIEQTLNLWRCLEWAADATLIGLLDEAREVFTEWVRHLETPAVQAPDPRDMIAQAAALRAGIETGRATVREGAPAGSTEGNAEPLPIDFASETADAPIAPAETEEFELSPVSSEKTVRWPDIGKTPPPSKLPASAESIPARNDSGRETDSGSKPKAPRTSLPSALIEEIDGLYPTNGEKMNEALPPNVAEEARETAMAPVRDDLDAQLLPIFLEEAADLTQSIAGQLRVWRDGTDDGEAVRVLARQLHTLKGSARVAGAMTLSEIAHLLEARVDQARRAGAASAKLIDGIENDFEAIRQIIEGLPRGETMAAEDGVKACSDASGQAETAPTPEDIVPGERRGRPVDVESDAPSSAMLRVRVKVVDRLVNEVGELSIARSRLEGEMRGMKEPLWDLDEIVLRLRRQLREIAAMSDEKSAGFDRVTCLQEWTRGMAESIDDVAAVRQELLRNLDGAHEAIVAQARQNREVQQQLLSLRMVPFHHLADRLYRVLRQASKELGKRANMEIEGGQIELDRSVLDRIAAPLEHLLRNAMAHGIEGRAERIARGKPEIGEILCSLRQEGNEVTLVLSDDGVGLEYARIRERAVAAGRIGADEAVDEARLAEFIFAPGFSTAQALSQTAGRGIGLDVVKTEITRLGGRVEVESRPGQGVEFRLILPLTLVVTQALLIRSGNETFAIPSSMVAQVLDLGEEDLARLREAGHAEWQSCPYPFHYLPHLLGDMSASPGPRRRYWVLLLRSGEQRIAVQVDELRGNQEIVVKNTGAQLARVVGVEGATVLDNGQVVLILNPVALGARVPTEMPVHAAASEPAQDKPPTLMIVDDSRTVRKTTARWMAREGYQVILARDGIEAREILLDTVPDVMLVDIEMPRMDGFDLTRHIRADARLKHVPIIMITSHTAERHRNLAFEIGVDHYLGKPCQQKELTRLVAGCVKAGRETGKGETTGFQGGAFPVPG